MGEGELRVWRGFGGLRCGVLGDWGSVLGVWVGGGRLEDRRVEDRRYMWYAVQVLIWYFLHCFNFKIK